MKLLILLTLMMTTFSLYSKEIFSTDIIGKWKYDFMGTESSVSYKQGGKVVYGDGTPHQLIGSWEHKNNKLITITTLPDKTKHTEISKIISYETNKIVIKDSNGRTLILTRI